MKNYAVLNKDFSPLIAEINSYIDGISSPEYEIQLYHRLGLTEDLISDIPSLETAFSDENLTAIGVSYRAIDNVVRAVEASCPVLLIPLKNTKKCTFSVVTLTEGALAYKDYASDHDFYSGLDCDIVDTISVTGPILINTGVTYTIENSDYNLAKFAMVAFNEDVSRYFA